MFRTTRTITSCIGLIVFFSLGFTTALWAQVPENVTVASQYRDPVTSLWGKEATWIFTKAAGARSGGYELEVRPGEAGAEPTAVLSYEGDGTLRRVNRFLRGAGRTRSVADSFTDKIVLSEGFPVPYDFLSPQDTTLKKMTIKQKAGGMVFSSQVERAMQECSFNEALQAGWISESVKDQLAGERLQWIEVRKDDALVVRQLWPAGSSWWVYEETPYRRSWTLKISMKNDQ